MRRFYNWCIVQNMKMVMDRHREELFQDPAIRDNIGINEEEVFSASSLQELDETFSRSVSLTLRLPYSLSGVFSDQPLTLLIRVGYPQTCISMESL